VRRLALLIAAGTLWLFLAAIPALADGGPHVASVNSGSTSLTADGCAGCHRAHTAQGEALLTSTSEEALCLSCHNATATGATTDVMTGVQYVKATATDGTPARGAILGYLRDGGFDQAHLGSSDGELMRVGYYRATDTVSFRMKVPAEVAAEDTTSAHLDLDGAGGVDAKNVIWGNGVANADSPTAEISCASCHNPHGNGQYRILNTLNTNTDVVNATAATITNVYASTDRFFTSGAHNLVVGDVVTISGVGVSGDPFFAAAQYIVKSNAGNTFTVALAPTKTSADISGAVINVTANYTGGTVKRYSALVDDAPLPAANDNRNYTIIQTKGTQGSNATYLLYQSNVLAARTAGTFNGLSGDYSAASGDNFHRTVPWNPALNAAASNCNTTNPPAGGSLPAACNTANDAPNGRPATDTTLGQVAYNDQISAWCSTCHTRYYSSTNPNPTGTEPSSTADTAKTIASTNGNDILSPAGAAFGFALGDTVKFSGVAGNYYVVYYATSGSGAAQVATMRVSNTFEAGPVPAPGAGTVTRVYPFSASSWYFERPVDDLYKFQHQTSTNRACTTCHVGHGSDAKMPGAESGSLAYPDGSAATVGFNSRLLKIDNRGTCQACHDPTGTATAGAQLGNQAAPTVP
jgi:predicted CXXCH cytochrome family protein